MSLPASAGEPVNASTAVDGVGADIAEDRVGQGIAGTGEVAGALQHQGFHVRRERVIDGGQQHVRAFIGVLEHQIAGIIDKIGIVAGTPKHGVGAARTVEQVVPDVAVKGIRLVVAVTLEIAAALQHQGLDVRGQPVVAEREHRVVALVGNFEAGVARIVDEIGVVAGAAHHQVDAARCVDEIVTGIAIDHVGLVVAVGLQIGIALQDQVFDIRRQPVIGGGKYAVVTLVGDLEAGVAGSPTK